MAGEGEIQLSERDTKQLEAVHTVLLELQRRTLSFLTKLGKYEKETRGDNDAASTSQSRVAFIVTPLMVNHYNHMHSLFSASMYGKVPDLCDQTGGIVCTDMSALRERISGSSAVATAAATKSLADTFRSATLPDVRFDFKKVRDEVVERAIRALDSMDIRHPDLTHSIRDDYIQNVRAIQETMTDALQRSKERAAELQARLDEAHRKLRFMEKTVASLPDETETLRLEIFKLKEQKGEFLNEIAKMKFKAEADALEMKRRDGEKRLLDDLQIRIRESATGGAEEMDRIRKDVTENINAQMKQMHDDLKKLRATVVADVEQYLEKERMVTEETLKSVAAVTNRGDGATATLSIFKEKLDEIETRCRVLEQENDELKRRLSERETVVDPMDYQPVQESSYEANIHNERVYLQELNQELIQANQWLMEDFMKTVYFFDLNVDLTLRLAEYVHEHNVVFNSPFGREFLRLLEEKVAVNKDNIVAHRMDVSLRNAEEIIHSSGIMNELEKYQHTTADGAAKIQMVSSAVSKLLVAMKTAYERLSSPLNMPNFDAPTDTVTPDLLVPVFEKNFGEPLLNAIRVRIAELTEDTINASHELQEATSKINELEREKRTNTIRNAKNPEQFITAFDAKPPLFREFLMELYRKNDDDILRQILVESYYAVGVDRVSHYESMSDCCPKLFELIDYTVIIDGHVEKKSVAPEHPHIDQDRFFLDHFIAQLGHKTVERYVKQLDIKRLNTLAYSIFETFYIPVANKKSFVASIAGPFANFNMIYKV